MFLSVSHSRLRIQNPKHRDSVPTNDQEAGQIPAALFSSAEILSYKLSYAVHLVDAVTVGTIRGFVPFLALMVTLSGASLLS